MINDKKFALYVFFTIKKWIKNTVGKVKSSRFFSMRCRVKNKFFFLLKFSYFFLYWDIPIIPSRFSSTRRTDIPIIPSRKNKKYNADSECQSIGNIRCLENIHKLRNSRPGFCSWVASTVPTKKLFSWQLV